MPWFGWLLLCLAVVSCSKKTATVQAPIFKTRNSQYTGLTFANTLTPTPKFNLFTYMYFYNGSGLGAGDFNNDGLIDLFFSANQGSNKIFLNKGHLNFEDVTAAAQVPQDAGWSTGVSVVDINNDGLLDIYVCKVGHYEMLHSKNQLLICSGVNKEGIPVYKDEAQAYGLDFSGFCTQAAFFDYDGDGDLDMFLLNHAVNHDGNYAPRKDFLNTYDSLAGQKLFRNDSYKNASGQSVKHFTDVTKQCGINGSRIGYGLGVAVSDINLDGWPDLYVGNDFHENDYLYINQKNGTFSEELNNRLEHTSKFTMGVDMADVNNDAYPEIISMDMLAYDPYILRRSLADDDYTTFTQKIAYGYNYQYSRNNLQYNRRNGMFSEAGAYAGVYASDWSWGPLWMDFDNDGRKDLFISNGIPRRMNDIDYINFVSNDEMQQKLRNNSMEDKDMLLVDKFPEIKIPNKFFYNTGELKFKDESDSVEANSPTFSNGGVYADLDNDGDLDVVVNNINDPALLYENTANDAKSKPVAAVTLKGPENNVNAIGARLVLFTNTGIRTYENTPVHGFQSSMQQPIEVGLYQTKIDSAFLIWPDNSYQSIILAPDQRLSFAHKPGLPKFNYNLLTLYNKAAEFPVENIAAKTGLNFLHTENSFNEFDREPLLPHMLSTDGPALAVADINGDGMSDVFIGASKTFHNAVFLQQPNGTFLKKAEPELVKDSMWENVSAVWTDVNNDKAPDLVIASGGNEYYGEDVHLLPLLYLNDGHGSLSRKADAFTGIYSTQSVVTPCDFNGDGFMDLFIGGRANPWDYGSVPRSYLLQNDGTGKFTDVTGQFAKDLSTPGFVTDATWIDLDTDGRADLVLCYEWGGIEAFLHTQNGFVKKILTDKQGWWNFLLPCDVDNDGDMDFVAGNFGLNSKLKASGQQPVTLYYNDFDGNGKKEQVLTYFLNGEELPFATKQELEKQLPYLKKNFLYAGDFAKASLYDLFGTAKIAAAEKHRATFFGNVVLLNKGNLEFETKPLPFEAQLSSYRAAVSCDANGDALPDVLLAGNYYDNNVALGRNDADFGTLLLNKGAGNFECHTLNGLVLKGQVRRMQPIQLQKQKAFVLARNNDSLMVLQFKK